MSSSYAANLARWNATPLSRDSERDTFIMKRSRSRSSSPAPIVKLQGEYDSSDEDNVSLVSRSPSPSPEKTDISKYDEYHPAAEKEVITVETRINSSNKGYAMLSRLGWTAGEPLGLSRDGRVDPIPFAVKNDLTGLGKRAQDERMIETTVSQRRGLDSERQIRETMEQRSSREQKVAEKEALANQIADTLKAFYCALCDKQYQNVAQYDEHTNSYAHHHKQRFKDMQANAKGLGGGKQEKEARLAKERKREEKELKRMAKARGVKVSTIGVAAPVIQGLDTAATAVIEESKPAKKAGWAAVATPVQSQPSDTRRAPCSTIPTGTRSALRENSGFRTAGFERLDPTSNTLAPDISENSSVVTNHVISNWSLVSSSEPRLPPIPPCPPPPPVDLPPPPPPPPPTDLPPPPLPLPDRPHSPSTLYPVGRPSYSESHSSRALHERPLSQSGYDGRPPSRWAYSSRSHFPSRRG